MINKHPICPVCEGGELSPITYSDTFQHHGSELRVEGLEACECVACGADPVLADQVKRNHRRIVDARRVADGLLTGDEIRALRKRLNLSQKDASELFGGGANAFSKYERGDVVQSVPMDRLLRLVALYPALLNDLQLYAGLETETNLKGSNAYTTDVPIRLDDHGGYASRPTGKAVVVEMASWQNSRRVA